MAAAAKFQVFHCYVDGFTVVVATVAEIETWARDLRARYGLAGKTLKIWRGVGTLAAATFSPVPTREIVL